MRYTKGMKQLPSTELLWSRFAYNPLTGELHHLPRKGVKAGAVAGYINPDGYRMAAIDKTKYLAHRLVWKWVTGRDPVGEIDHVGQEGASTKSNVFHGLQDVSHRENLQRSLKARGLNGMGVTRLKDGKWQAQPRIGGKKIYLGRFRTEAEAIEAVKLAS